MNRVAIDHDSKRPCPWFRFRLQTLLIVLTLLCFILGLGGNVLIRSQRQRSAISRIKAAGGSVTFAHEFEKQEPPGPKPLRWLLGDEAFGDVVHLYWVDDACTDDELASLQQFPKLESLYVGSVNVSDDGARQIATIDSLQSLHLHGGHLTADGIAALGRLPRLTELALGGTDSALAPVGGFTRLEALQLTGNGITAKGLLSISELNQLQSLALIQMDLSTDDFRVLQQLKNLKGLRLEWTPIDRAGLTHLATLPCLEGLYIRCQVHPSISLGDDDLVALQEFPALRELSLEHCQISPVGIAHVGRLTNLRWLQLSCKSVTDDCLEDIARLVNLEDLDLQQSTIYNRGQSITKLRKLKKLKRVRFPNTVAMDDALQFQRALPHCEVYAYSGSGPELLPKPN